MKIQYYCYTRGDKPDYRDFVVPNNLQGSDITAVRGIVKSVLESDLKEPVWILYKTTDIVIWGVCCRNSLLSKLYNSDEKSRAVNGFFSIVISDFSVWDLRIPYDLSYFKKLYENEVVPHWFCGQGESFSNLGRDIYDGIYLFINASKNEFISHLNADIFLSKRLGLSTIEGVIASALTLDTVTLAVGYDGTNDISNTKAIFMNSIVPGKKEKIVPVKRACPMCGKLVTHYTDSGICDECTPKTEQNSPPIDAVKDQNMKYKDEELIEIKRQLRDCRLEIVEKDKKIKKQNRQIQIMWIVCGLLLLLCLWLFNHSDIRINTDLASNRTASQQSTSKDFKQDTLFFKIDSQKVEVMAERQDSVVVNWRTNYPNVEVKLSDVDWAKITHKTMNSVILSIQANESPNARLAQIKVKPSGGKEITIKLFQKSAE